MKKLSNLLVAVVIASMSLFMTGCFGSFALTKKVYDWNGSLDNKFVQEAVFLGLNIIPVYGVSAFLDAVILNTVEFWSGSSPLALKEGINKVDIAGNELTILVDKNTVTLYNDQNSELALLTYSDENSTWYSTVNGITNKLMTIDGDNIQLYTSNGQSFSVNKADFNSESTLNRLNELTALK